MGYSQIQAPNYPKQSANGDRGCLVLTSIICGTIWILITTSVAAQAISVANYLMWLLLGGGTIVFYISLTKRNKKEEQQALMQYHQTQQAWIQYHQAQQEWRSYQDAQQAAYRAAKEQAERERLKREARERAERQQLQQERLERSHHERLAQQAKEQAERERLAQEAREQAEQEARWRVIEAQIQRELLERLHQQHLEQQAREQAERERLAQEAREQAEREEAEQERKELEQLERLKTLDGILRLAPTEFEHFVCKLLSTYEYLHDVKRVGGSGDLAVDLAARDRDGNLIIIQCKRYMPGNKVGSNEIQKFIGMMYVHHQASKGIFITTSTYTQPALALAEKHDIFLINGERLVDIVKNRLAR